MPNLMNTRNGPPSCSVRKKGSCWSLRTPNSMRIFDFIALIRARPGHFFHGYQEQDQDQDIDSRSDGDQRNELEAQRTVANLMSFQRTSAYSLADAVHALHTAAHYKGKVLKLRPSDVAAAKPIWALNHSNQ